MDYVLIIAFDLRYGQLLVLDGSLSVLLGITRNCEIALCTLMSEINDDDNKYTVHQAFHRTYKQMIKQ